MDLPIGYMIGILKVIIGISGVSTGRIGEYSLLSSDIGFYF